MGIVEGWVWHCGGVGVKLWRGGRDTVEGSAWHCGGVGGSHS